MKKCIYSWVNSTYIKMHGATIKKFNSSGERNNKLGNLLFKTRICVSVIIKVFVCHPVVFDIITLWVARQHSQ